jgi:hypothetical protein
MPNDAPVTKTELQTELQAFKADLLPTLKASIGEAVTQLREYIDERTHDMETRLLRAFADYQMAKNG